MKGYLRGRFLFVRGAAKFSMQPFDHEAQLGADEFIHRPINAGILTGGFHPRIGNVFREHGAETDVLVVSASIHIAVELSVTDQSIASKPRAPTPFGEEFFVSELGILHEDAKSSHE